MLSFSTIPLLNYSICCGRYWGCGSKIIRCITSNSKLAIVKDSGSTNLEALIKEPHKYFDQVIITVRSGDGGHGAVLSLPVQKITSKSQGKHEKDKKKKNSFRRDSDGSLFLPLGGHGGDVVLYADESTESLLELHKKKRYSAKRGGNVGTMGVLTSHMCNGSMAPILKIAVPVGM
ncbi:hypothetical protein KSP40_PGU006596 [Platanthera guangdongensis]|uniref:Obg domain-containing protein n=1 Tax=Platanthera guangdongensis TaxID=2320717 RepID=A0ABR2LW80_9ASPA